MLVNLLAEAIPVEPWMFWAGLGIIIGDKGTFWVKGLLRRMNGNGPESDIAVMKNDISHIKKWMERIEAKIGD